MDCSCCLPENINDLDKTFGRARAEKDARRYLQKGLDKRSRKLIAYLQSNVTRPVSVLDIGCGSGSVHLELLRRGVADQAIGIDAASAYLDAAQDTAEELGLEKSVTYHHSDFALQAQAFEPADVVVMDRVICCYPHLGQLLGQAAERTHLYLTLSYPVDFWLVRLAYRAVDAFLTVMGSGYRPYLHSGQQIQDVAQSAALVPVHKDRSGLWRIVVFERDGSAVAPA